MGAAAPLAGLRRTERRLASAPGGARAASREETTRASRPPDTDPRSLPVVGCAGMPLGVLPMDRSATTSDPVAPTSAQRVAELGGASIARLVVTGPVTSAVLASARCG